MILVDLQSEKFGAPHPSCRRTVTRRDRGGQNTSNPRGDQAVVPVASMAGAARGAGAGRDHPRVTVVDPDVMPAIGEHRQGCRRVGPACPAPARRPGARLPLPPRSAVPGLLTQLAAPAPAAATAPEPAAGSHPDTVPQEPSGMSGALPSRPFLDAHPHPPPPPSPPPSSVSDALGELAGVALVPAARHRRAHRNRLLVTPAMGPALERRACTALVDPRCGRRPQHGHPPGHRIPPGLPGSRRAAGLGYRIGASPPGTADTRRARPSTTRRPGGQPLPYQRPELPRRRPRSDVPDWSGQRPSLAGHGRGGHL